MIEGWGNKLPLIVDLLTFDFIVFEESSQRSSAGDFDVFKWYVDAKELLTKNSCCDIFLHIMNTIFDISNVSAENIRAARVHDINSAVRR